MATRVGLGAGVGRGGWGEWCLKAVLSPLSMAGPGHGAEPLGGVGEQRRSMDRRAGGATACVAGVEWVRTDGSAATMGETAERDGLERAEAVQCARMHRAHGFDDGSGSTPRRHRIGEST